MEEIVVTENVEIFVDTTRGSIKLEVPKATKIGDVVGAVVAKIQMGQQEMYELVHEGVVLKPERTLESYAVKTGDRLDLTRVTLVG
jgi:hypothetical protein